MKIVPVNWFPVRVNETLHACTGLSSPAGAPTSPVTIAVLTYRYYAIVPAVRSVLVWLQNVCGGLAKSGPKPVLTAGIAPRTWVNSVPSNVGGETAGGEVASTASRVTAPWSP